MIFIDTSAIYALADRGDPLHDQAKERFASILSAGETIFTHNYVLVESLALLQARIGIDAALALGRSARAFQVEWVDESSHQEGIRQLERSRKRQVSFVDQMSFLIMRRRRLDTAFAFDPHFTTEGFNIFGA
jgi:predicted nucleic acid-binding protein